MSDNFANHASALSSPATDGTMITPNDSTLLSVVTRAIYIGGGGNLTVELLSGAVVTFMAMPTGFFAPIRARKVLTTGTTATGLVGVW